MWKVSVVMDVPPSQLVRRPFLAIALGQVVQRGLDFAYRKVRLRLQHNDLMIKRIAALALWQVPIVVQELTNYSVSIPPAGIKIAHKSGAGLLI